VLTLTYYYTCVDIDSWASFGFSNNNIFPKGIAKNTYYTI